MIDTERWILAEAWIANGLRLRWAANFEVNAQNRPEMFGEARRYYWYAGFGEWAVLPPDTSWRPLGREASPQLETADMRHELAHWMVASREAREKVNFGGLADDDEERALAAERVIEAMARGAARIADMALTPLRR